MTKHIDVDRIVELAARGLTNAQIAREMGCATRTIDRRRAAYPEFGARMTQLRNELREAALQPCPSLAAYRRGCRCVGCTAANTSAAAQRTERRRERLGLTADPNWRKRTKALKPIEVQVETHIARGERVVDIMRELDVSYGLVKEVSDRMRALSA